MIITSHEKFEVGRIYNGKDVGRPFEYHGIKHTDYVFYIIREATVEEYRESLLLEEKELIEQGMHFEEWEYFYKISVD